MNILLKGGSVISSSSAQPKNADILILDGVIKSLGPDLSSPDVPSHDCSGKTISPGWMDMHVHLREPGYEHKETIKSGCAAAAAGGFTAVACMPNTNPPIHTRDVVEFVADRASGTGVDVHPIGTVSKERAGKELAEMADMVAGGAVAFSDDGSPVYDSGLMRRALEYSASLGVPIINHMEDLQLNPHGQMHEGAVSTRLGLAGIPALAEEVMIARDILIAESTGGHVHVAHISTGKAVEMVRQAKARGIKVTAEVCTHHFSLSDEHVEKSNYSTNSKMHPPLRSENDIEMMKLGLKDGTIDAICTDHAPHASFEKEVEFVAAPFGIIGLETAWGIVGKELLHSGVMPLSEVLATVIEAPRRIMGLTPPTIAEGEKANLTIFDTETRWIVMPTDIKSASANTPYLGKELLGRVHAIYNDGIFLERENIAGPHA